MSDPDLDDLGLAIPEFRVPSRASGFKADPSEATDDELDDDFESENTQHIPTDQLESELENDAAASDFHDAPTGRFAEPEKFDRAELVKTVRMDAFDRKAVEGGFSPMWNVVGRLDDQRFAPDVLVLPPRVLTRKWQEGTRTKPNGSPGYSAPAQVPRSELATTVKTPTASTPPSSESEPQLDDEHVEEISEAMELEGELIEEVKPPPKPAEPLQRDRVPSPQPGLEPRNPAPATRRQPQRQAHPTGPLAAQPTAGEDDDLSGIVQELLDEKKPKPERKKTRPIDKRTNWFQEVFSEEYFRTLPRDIDAQTEREVRFIHQSLGLRKGARILDLACGFGRHTIELARRDYEVAGLDASRAMLERALAEAKRRDLSIKFIHGDMRDLGFNEIFDAVVSWQTSFGYFDDRTNVSIAQGIARAVKPGGRFLLDVVNRDHVVAEMPSRTWWEGHECVFLEEVEFDPHTSILHTKRSFIYEDGATPPREFSSYIRLYSLHELRQLLYFAGFRVLEVSGAIHHRGNFLGPSSPRIIILAERVPPRE